MHIKHSFTTAYCPWSDGTVERKCKEVIRISHALLSEWRLSTGQWPAVLDVIQRIIHHSPVHRLGKNENGNTRCPMEVFLGLRPSLLGARLTPLRRYRDIKSTNAERCHQIADIGRIHTVLEQMHKDVSNSNQK